MGYQSKRLITLCEKIGAGVPNNNFVALSVSCEIEMFKGDNPK